MDTPELIRIVYVGQGQAPVPMVIDNSLKAFQRLVRGFVEMVRMEDRLGPGLKACVNEEGALIPLPHNRCGIRGDFFITRVDAEGENVSLSDHDIEVVLAHLELYKALPATPVGGGTTTIITGDSLEEVLEKRARLAEDDLRRN